jgi:Rod binding domain-containing protein
MEGLSPDAGLLASLGLSQAGGPNLTGIKSQEAAAAAAKEFEGFFVSQMLSAMFAGVKTPAPFGGGAGEASFQGLLMEEYGKLISKSGGIGLSGPLQAEILRLQEVG